MRIWMILLFGPIGLFPISVLLAGLVLVVYGVLAYQVPVAMWWLVFVVNAVLALVVWFWARIVERRREARNEDNGRAPVSIKSERAVEQSLGV